MQIKMTNAQFWQKHPDFRAIINGKRYVLVCRNGATVLAPVKIVAE
jgi:hypothetical protein